MALALVTAAALTVVAQDTALERRKRFPAESDLLYLPRPSALKALSLGHHELTADLVFIRAIIYFGGELAGRRTYTWLDNYLETIVALDPQWKTPYRWAGVATMYHGKTITPENVKQSIHFLEMGAKQFPDDWELPFMAGCNYLFELKTDDPDQKRTNERRGAELVRHAALQKGAPSWVPLLAATMMQKEGREEAAMRHLEEIFVSTRDDKTRAEVKNRLLAMHAKIDFKKAERDHRAFEAAWRATVPYAPPDFFVAMGGRPSVRMDLKELAKDPVLHLDLDAELVE
jgi:hypothetical protein